MIYTKGVHAGSLQIEYDEITMKTKLVLYQVGGWFISIGTLKFNEKSSFNTILGFKLCWDYKPTNEYTSQKIVNLSTTNKLHLNCDVVDGGLQKGLLTPVLFNFLLVKPSGYKVFYEPETFQYKRIIKSVLNTVSFHFEVDNHEKVDFNGETLSYTLQMIKIWAIKWACKKWKW